MVSTWKKKQGKTSKFMDEGGYKENEKEGDLTTYDWSTEQGGE